MFVPFIVLSTLGATFAGYAGSSSNNVGDGSGYGYGYSGSFSGNNGGNVPIPPIPQFDFGFFANYLDSLQKYHEQFLSKGGGVSYSYASSMPNSNAKAQSSITFTRPDKLKTILRIQDNVQQIPNAGGGAGGFSGGSGSSYSGGNGAGFGSGFGTGFSGNGQGAFASGSIGPGGGYQSAKIYPENPNNPNIETRFGGGNERGNGGGPGFYSVSSFSSSATKDVNGQPQSVHQASTTVNDNGKVSTYTVKNP